MAIANQANAAALARSFADEFRAVPGVKRIWYWAKVGHHVPGLLSLDLFLLLERSDGQVQAAVTEAMRRIEMYRPDMMLAIITFTEEEVAYYADTYEAGGDPAEDFLRDDSVEIPVRST